MTRYIYLITRALIFCFLLPSFAQANLGKRCLELLGINHGSLEATLRKKFSVGEQGQRFDRILTAISLYSMEDKTLILEKLNNNLILEKIDHALRLGQRDGIYNLAHAIDGSMEASSVDMIRVTRGNRPEFRSLVGDARRETEDLLHENGIRFRSDQIVGEGYVGKVFDGNNAVLVPGLSQCRATFVFNYDTGRLFVYHSSTGMGQDVFRSIAELGPGKKAAFVVGHWNGSNEAELLKTYLGITGTVILLDDAVTHVNVIYSPSKKSLLVGYGNKEEYYVGAFPVEIRK